MSLGAPPGGVNGFRTLAADGRGCPGGCTTRSGTSAQVLDLALDVLPVVGVGPGGEIGAERRHRERPLAALLVGEPDVVVGHGVARLGARGALEPRERLALMALVVLGAADLVVEAHQR